LPYILISRVFRPMVLSGQWNVFWIKSLTNFWSLLVTWCTTRFNIQQL
jgi:hypothetical protein